MNRLRWIALISVILLGGLLVYVAEDIPAFGDPDSPSIKYVKLFSMKAEGLENHLNQGMIPEPLMNQLKKRMFPGPFRVEKADGMERGWNAWVVKEERHYPREEKYYWIKKEGDEITVYRYAFVVRWMEKGQQETGVPNMVTYGLADYRSYDTLGEVTVIFTAGVSVILLIRRRGRL